MGFVGSTPAPLRTFLADIASTVLAGRKIYLGCSGNFTIESILSKTCPSAILHSNDVSLYSSAIGYMLTGRQLDLSVTVPDLVFLEPYIQDGVSQVATILLLLEMLKYRKQNNDFRVRMWRSYMTHFPDLHQGTVQKIRKATDHIRCATYTTTDVADYYPAPPREVFPSPFSRPMSADMKSSSRPSIVRLRGRPRASASLPKSAGKQRSPPS